MNKSRASLLLIPALLACVAAAGCDRTPEQPPRQVGAKPAAVRPVIVAPEVADFYRERGNRPLWIANGALKPEAVELAAMIEHADVHGLDPERYGASELAEAVAASRSGDKNALARAELLLSRAYTDFVPDLRGPAANGMKYVDPGLSPEAPSAHSLLDEAAAAPSLRNHLAAATAMNPLYDSLSRGFARWRSAGPRSEAEIALARANLDRARAIPAHTGRYVIVDTASARLWMIDGDRVEAPMKVIVGKPYMQTPVMAASMRYVTLNPYWNMPPDLARERARKILRQGTGLIARERLQILSDWGDHARPVAASQVDWGAVAAGRRSLRLRQLPGGANVMGAVKFMMPNEMGIYLHDFPDKSLFARADRRLSSGCVRLSDAPRLARWVFRGAAPSPSGRAAEQNVNLPEPVPVYITYLTMLPGGPDGLTFQPDSYRRDRSLMARARTIKAKSLL